MESHTTNKHLSTIVIDTKKALENKSVRPYLVPAPELVPYEIQATLE